MGLFCERHCLCALCRTHRYLKSMGMDGDWRSVVWSTCVICKQMDLSYYSDCGQVYRRPESQLRYLSSRMVGETQQNNLYHFVCYWPGVDIDWIILPKPVNVFLKLHESVKRYNRRLEQRGKSQILLQSKLCFKQGQVRDCKCARRGLVPSHVLFQIFRKQT